MKTATRWGEPSTNIHMFHRTPFGLVRLNNFQKIAPDRFAVWLTAMSTDVEMTITWWDCSLSDAAEYFGIEATEQEMWDR